MYMELKGNTHVMAFTLHWTEYRFSVCFSDIYICFSTFSHYVPGVIEKSGGTCGTKERLSYKLSFQFFVGILVVVSRGISHTIFLYRVKEK